MERLGLVIKVPSEPLRGRFRAKSHGETDLLSVWVGSHFGGAWTLRVNGVIKQRPVRGAGKVEWPKRGMRNTEWETAGTAQNLGLGGCLA